MDKNILDHILCIKGYLPSRNEEEFTEFLKECAKVDVKLKVRVDTNKITSKK